MNTGTAYVNALGKGAAAAAAGGVNPQADLAAFMAEVELLASIIGNATSTSWKDNWDKLKGLTADQQIVYYIQNVSTGNLDTGFLNQYSELFGNKADKGANPAGGKSRVRELSYAMAKKYNDLYMQIAPLDPSINENLIDLSKTIQPLGSNLFSDSSGNSNNTTKNTNYFLFIVIVIFGVVLLSIIIPKRK